jgi:hypothetical protein
VPGSDSICSVPDTVSWVSRRRHPDQPIADPSDSS